MQPTTSASTARFLNREVNITLLVAIFVYKAAISPLISVNRRHGSGGWANVVTNYISTLPPSQVVSSVEINRPSLVSFR